MRWDEAGVTLRLGFRYGKWSVRTGPRNCLIGKVGFQRTLEAKEK